MANFPWIGLAIGVGCMVLIVVATSRLDGGARAFFSAGVISVLLGLLISGSAGAGDQRAGNVFIIVGLAQVVLAFVPTQRWVTVLRVVLLMALPVACMR